ncbi:MAG TPA: hypothetical protein VH280_07000 [Verrucomicrobiae bacterium]|jgi:hypothetical protein|nr:hypothetical protein [Verrucomicrobiae bacterium]
MNRVKQIPPWLVIGAMLVCLVGNTQRPPNEQASVSQAQAKEWELVRINLTYGSRMAWRAAMSRAMLVKANWLANRLNLPIQRPIQTSDIRTWDIGDASFRVLRQYPSWIPDTVYGTNFYHTNISCLQRILALKFGIGGVLDTPNYHFSFADGQLVRIASQKAYSDKLYRDRFTEIMAAPHVHPAQAKTDEVYKLATNWLAAVDVNLATLEKSRLPHPVRQEEAQPDSVTQSQPVYFIAWGTNYYGLNDVYHYWHTNEWRPVVMVEIGSHNELLEMFVGDPAFFHNPPTIIPSQIVWRLLHTPDPPVDQLLNPSVMREFILTPEDASNAVRDARTPLWFYQHHLITNTDLILDISNNLNYLHSVLIPYKPGDDPVFDTNQP